jgi:hypothetical protein
MDIVGRIAGKSICNNLLNLDAPSISAASYKSVSTPDKAAIYIIVPQPEFCHMPDQTYKCRKASGLLNKSFGLIPFNNI